MAYKVAKPLATALPITFMGWIYNGSSTANGRVLCAADEATDNEWLLLYVDNSTGFANATSTAGGVQVSATGTTDCRNKWHQVTAVYESTTSRKVYVDGRLEGTNTTSNSPNFSTFDSVAVGVLQRFNLLFGTQTLSCLSLWNRALSPSEIRWLFENPYGDFVLPRRRVSKTGVAATPNNGRMFLTF